MALSNSTDRFNGVLSTLAIKAPCVAVAIANITLSGEQTVNGVAVVAGDRVLVTAQTSSVDNGIYDASSSVWTRSADFDGNRDVVSGTFVTVATATVGRNPYYQITTANPITIGTTAINFTLADGPNVSYALTTAEAASGLTANDINDSFEPSNVLRHGATGDGATDDSAAIQADIDVGQNVYFPPGDYRCANLTDSNNFNAWWADGSLNVLIRKNANGPIVTFSGLNQILTNLAFRGEDPVPVLTGDNVVSSGNNFAMINCSSRNTLGRPVLATGGHVQILGTNDIYATNDATATGFDLEIGISGTATLYHQLEGIYSAQSTGGIHLIDVGSHTILGGQFGKLFIDAGTSPPGVNGGKTIGARILGVVDVEISSALFSCCQLGANADLTFAAGTSGCSFDLSNSESGSVFTNNGNANNLMMREISAGSVQQIKYGDDSSTAILQITKTGAGRFRPSALELPNNIAFAWRNAADDGDAYSIISNVAGDVTHNNLVASRTTDHNVQSGGRHQYSVAGVVKAIIDVLGIGMGATGSPTIYPARTGTPEGNVTAIVGSLITRDDGGANTTLYVKESGTGNTGWIAK